MLSPSGFQISTHVTKLKQRNNKYAGAQPGFLKRGERGSGGQTKAEIATGSEITGWGSGDATPGVKCITTKYHLK